MNVVATAPIPGMRTASLSWLWAICCIWVLMRLGVSRRRSAEMERRRLTNVKQGRLTFVKQVSRHRHYTDIYLLERVAHGPNRVHPEPLALKHVCALDFIAAQARRCCARLPKNRSLALLGSFRLHLSALDSTTPPLLRAQVLGLITGQEAIPCAQVRRAWRQRRGTHWMLGETFLVRVL